jgi:hypothetical protein
MGEMEFELSRIYNCLTNPEAVLSAELIGERIFFDAFSGDYDWNDDELAARRRMASGTEIVARSLNDDSVIELVVTYGAQGYESRKNVSKYLPKSCDQAKRILRENGWTIVVDHVDHNSARLSGRVDVQRASSLLGRWPAMLKEIDELFAFT